MRRQLLLALTVLSALAVGGTAIAHEVTHKSTVTLHYANDAFRGKVTSPHGKCEEGRTVKVFLVEGEENSLITTATTDEDGFYSVAHEDAAEGEYFARVTREVLSDTKEHTHACAADRSRILPVKDPAAA